MTPFQGCDSNWYVVHQASPDGGIIGLHPMWGYIAPSGLRGLAALSNISGFTRCGDMSPLRGWAYWFIRLRLMVEYIAPSGLRGLAALSNISGFTRCRDISPLRGWED